MDTIKKLLTQTSHRPFEMPKNSWKYYQEWNDALFLHTKVNYEKLRPLVPSQLDIDSFNGAYYISVVAFRMEKIRPKNLPSSGFISNFYEINVRTYVKHNDYKGVYFLSIEAEKLFSTIIAKKLSGLPYEKSSIKRSVSGYINKNKRKNFYLDVDFSIGKKINHKTDLDIWLTERYCLFVDQEKKIKRYDIQHLEWELNVIDQLKLSLHYKFDQILLNQENITFTHYSKGVKVIAWDEKEI